MKIKIGDIVIRKDGCVGFVDDVCHCEECKKRGWDEPIVKYVNVRGVTYDCDYITNYEFKNGLWNSYKRIGKYDFEDESIVKKLKQEYDVNQFIKKLDVDSKELNDIKTKWKELAATTPVQNSSLVNQSVSILNQVVDLTELNKKIESYEIGLYGNKAPYLIMSQETADAFAKHFNLINATKFNYGSYLGCPIAICNKVKFGEVELR